MTKSCVEFDYSELRGRIKTVLGNEGNFAKAIHRTNAFVSKVFNAKTYFSPDDVISASDVLGIETNEIGRFFYTIKVHKSEQ